LIKLWLADNVGEKELVATAGFVPSPACGERQLCGSQ